MPFQFDDGFRGGASDRSEPAEVIPPPAACPKCKSQSISTTARVPDQHAYWRCSNCGEVWNDVRHKAAARNRMPWR
jgi:transposase-like protein